MFDIDGLDIQAQLQALERCEAEDSLYLFLRAAWKYIDATPWVDSWAIEAIAEHLQAVCDGEIKRLLINQPPRTGKSSTLSVAFPAWVWAQEHNSPTSGSGVQIVAASYATQLAMRDSVKCRRLIESPWYQKLWNGRFRLTTDQNTKGRFANDKGGERLITSVSAGVTGEGGNLILIDDPNAANEAFSEATVAATLDWFDGTISTRLNDAKNGAFIISQQRLAEDDLSGHILSKDKGEWTHLMLPMHYDPDRSFVTNIGWKDPRTVTGELLWPERFGHPEVRALEASLGPTLSAGQLEQTPQPAGGGVIKREWWKLWEEAAFPPFDYVLASLDTAYTMKTENDYSALTVWGVFSIETKAVSTRAIGKDGRPTYADRSFVEGVPKLMLMSAWQERLELHDLVAKVAATCKTLKVDKLLIENKAAGHSVAQEIRRIYGYEEFGVQLHDPGAQDKLARLYSVQHIWSEGMIHAPDKEWAEMTIAQVGQFPRGKHDDIVDTCSQAVRHLRDLGLLQRTVERMEEVNESLRYQGREPPPLYPA